MLDKFYEYIDNLSILKNDLNYIENKYPNTSELFYVHNDEKYKNIINNGKIMLPLLKEKLNSKYFMYWFNALENITNIKFSGNISEKKNKWINWFNER